MERFSINLIRKVRKSKNSYKKGKFVRLKNNKERRKLFEKL